MNTHDAFLYNDYDPTYEDLGNGEGAIQRPITNTKNAPNSSVEHLPAGQHLLVDIKGVQEEHWYHFQR